MLRSAIIGMAFVVAAGGAAHARKPAARRAAAKRPLRGRKAPPKRGKIGPVRKAAARTKAVAKGAKRGLNLKGKAGLRGGRFLRGFSRWRRNSKLRAFGKTFRFKASQWTRAFPRNNSTLQQARLVARRPTNLLGKATIDSLARILFVLTVEAPSEGRSFSQKVARLTVKRSGEQVVVGPDIAEQARLYERLYDVPCQARLRRVGKSWPPQYECGDRVQAPTDEPTPLVALRRPPQVLLRPPSEPAKDEEEKKKDAALGRQRIRILAERDRQIVPRENISGPKPSQFCVSGKCHGTYRAAALAIYGTGGDRYPVFCAPRRVGGQWNATRVECSSNWLSTLGTWKPWTASGEPSSAPEAGVIPPFACIGLPTHLVQDHLVLPPGGSVGSSGFHCRNRIFRFLAKKAPKNQADINHGLVKMCLEMRYQTWGEKYPNINELYAKWCNSPEGPKDKSLCPKKRSGSAAGAGAPPALPFMLLSREELLYFFGHQELYCRADRVGLTHFLFNKEWAKTFTCGVSRGLIEAGPFEEGVQTCALAPYVDVEAAKGVLEGDHLKARLHCWRFNRPTCEAVSRDQTKDDIHRSAVFDAFDALRQARRTRHRDSWSFYDMKDAEKLQDWSSRIAFQDTAADEGVFGVKQFCRFVGGLTRFRCGYSKKTMAQWYDLHRNEEPQGCSTGVCARGAYQRGYYCGLFQSTEFFPIKDRRGRVRGGKPIWICGIDTGIAGRKILARSRAICVGGARVKGFQSARGDRTSLQCYERRYLWGESQRTEDILRRFSWREAVEAAAKISPHFEDWLAGGGQADMRRKSAPADQAQKVRERISAGFKAARQTLTKLSEKDEKELVRWAVLHGHTLGHRTSLRIGLLRSNLTAIKAFKKLKYRQASKLKYQPLGPSPKKYETFEYEIDKEKDKDAARDEYKTKELNELVAEVVQGSRAADRRWYQSFRLSATEGGQLRVPPADLGLALRVHHLFEVLEAARSVLLREAKAYADAVFAASRGSERYSRLEVHERARTAPIPRRFKGNIFCVAAQDPRDGAAYRPVYICASSPLLVAGRVERKVGRRLGRTRRRSSDRAQEKRAHKIRSKVRFDWCYGGTEGMRLYGYHPSPALYRQDLSSPYLMGVPHSVIKFQSRGRRLRLRGLRRKSRIFVPRRLQRLARGGILRETNDEVGGVSGLVAAPARLKLRRSAKRRAPAPKAGKKASPARKKKGGLGGGGFKLKLRLNLKRPSLGQARSTINWLKCGGFSYSDELWEDADPKRERKDAPPQSLPGAPPPPKDASSGDMAKAGKETGKIMKEIGGLLGKVLKVVLPDLADALERVQDLAHAAESFYNKYVKKFVDIATKVWGEQKKKINAARTAVGKARTAKETAETEFFEADKAYAAADPKQKGKLEPKRTAAEQKRDDARNALKDRERELAAALAAAKNKKSIPGTDAILSQLLDDLVKTITKRITGVIEPRARALLAKAFQFLRNFLDPLAMAVISALGAIPWVGGALAPLGKLAYKLAMDALQDAAFNGLFPLVERVFAKLVRSVVSPIFGAVKKKVLELALGACMGLFGSEVCANAGELKFAALSPKDRWIERALACKPREIIDDRIRRDAMVARFQIIRAAEGMRRRAHAMARDIANRYFARFGLTYDRWMAAVHGGPSGAWVARAQKIKRALRAEEQRLRALNAGRAVQ